MRQPSRPTTTRIAVIALIVTSLWGALLPLATPAAAVTFTVDLTVAGGTVGVAQTVKAVVGSDEVGAPTGKVVFSADGAQIGAQAVGGSSGSTAQIQWAPTASGPVTIEATFLADAGGQALDRLTVQIATVDTVTTVSVPGTAAAASRITLQATVKSKSGTYAPTGKVTFTTTAGVVLGSANVGSDGRASLSYTTPSASGTITLTASYAGDGNANTSKSTSASIKVSTTATTLKLAAPPSTTVGATVQLTATIVPSTTPGTVDFSANGVKLGTSRLSGGSASLSWKPTAVGTVTLTATFAGGSGVSGSTGTAKVQVGAALKQDTITVGPQGATPWSPGTPVVLVNGTVVPLSVSSASKLAVQLSIVGPCALTANTLTVRGVGGNCLLTASTKGGSDYAPASQRYTIGTGQGTQTAVIKAPPSGSYAKGRTLRLGRLTAVTSVNQPIRWRVTKGATRCTIVQTARFYTVKLKKRGLCRVRAAAPGIPGQWAPFSTTRTYRIR
jgi:hypothetical protein